MTGRCDRDRCECVGARLTLRAWCEHWLVPERRIVGDAEAMQQIWRWQGIPREQRLKCASHLRERVIAEAPSTALRWSDQVRRGMVVGSEDLNFHHGVGMQVRNTLRRVLPDESLPPIKYSDGSLARNWDDYYLGALWMAFDYWNAGYAQRCARGVERRIRQAIRSSKGARA